MSTSPLIQIAEQNLLAPSGLSINQLDRIFGQLATHQIDYADLYFQAITQESWSLEDGIVKDGSYHHENGVGVRAISGEKTGLAYSDEIALPALDHAAAAARSIANAGQTGVVKAWQARQGLALYAPENPLTTLRDAEKISLLQRVDEYTRRLDPRVIQVSISMAGVHETVLVLNNAGQMAADVRPLVRFNISVIVEENGRREQGYAGGGGRGSYQIITADDTPFTYAKEAVRQAIVNLAAVPAPAGMMPVILGPGWPGVLLHEAIGHGLEGDFNRKGSSAFSGKIGQAVASDVCTIVDDGTLPGRRGSLNMDDEGTPTACTVLIEDGILKNYMQDRLNAKLMNMQPTGNGRRESYAAMPMPRMTNTYMLAGKSEPAEMIASVEKGLYAVNFGGGQVDITSGKFVFSATEAYLIEKGKITQPVKGATLIGNGPEVLKHVTMVGNDLALDTGIGVCGKDGQSVPVGVGQPSLLIDELTVGGTN